jgi:hypothetical protein
MVFCHLALAWHMWWTIITNAYSRNRRGVRMLPLYTLKPLSSFGSKP